MSEREIRDAKGYLVGTISDGSSSSGSGDFEPWNKWVFLIGAFIGLVVGFSSAGIGGAIVGAVVGGVVFFLLAHMLIDAFPTIIF